MYLERVELVLILLALRELEESIEKVSNKEGLDILINKVKSEIQRRDARPTAEEVREINRLSFKMMLPS